MTTRGCLLFPLPVVFECECVSKHKGMCIPNIFVLFLTGARCDDYG